MIDVAGPPLATIGMVEEAVLFIIQNDSTAPLALATALLLSYLVTVVDPAALNGPFLSPFARLSFAGKMPARSRCWRPRSRRWSRYAIRANALGGANPTLTTHALATRTAEGKGIIQRYFGGDPWVKREAPVVSTDDTVTRAVVARGL